MHISPYDSHVSEHLEGANQNNQTGQIITTTTISFYLPFLVVLHLSYQCLLQRLTTKVYTHALRIKIREEILLILVEVFIFFSF